MGIGGLLARAALLKEQMKKKPCQRCGHYFDHSKYENCPHCKDLDEQGLQALFAQKELAFQGRKSLGMVFFILALITVFLLLAVSNV